MLQSNIEQVSREEDLTYDEVEGIFKFVSSQHKKKTLGEVKRLSMDEVSFPEGSQRLCHFRVIRQLVKGLIALDNLALTLRRKLARQDKSQEV